MHPCPACRRALRRMEMGPGGMGDDSDDIGSDGGPGFEEDWSGSDDEEPQQRVQAGRKGVAGGKPQAASAGLGLAARIIGGRHEVDEEDGEDDDSDEAVSEEGIGAGRDEEDEEDSGSGGDEEEEDDEEKLLEQQVSLLQVWCHAGESASTKFVYAEMVHTQAASTCFLLAAAVQDTTRAQLLSTQQLCGNHTSTRLHMPLIPS